VGSAAPRNKGLEMAKGEWICLLDDDDEFTPNHIEILLQRALCGYDFVHGKLLMIKPDGERIILGKHPPERGNITPASFIYNAKYKNIKCNVDPNATEEPGDWNLCRRILEAGANVSFVDDIVSIYFPVVRPWERKPDTVNDKSPAKIATLSSKSFIQEAVVVDLKNQLKDKENQIHELNQKMQLLEADLLDTEKHLMHLTSANMGITNSITWRIARKISRIVDTILPPNTRRRRIAKRVFLSFRRS
jgi:glycosyltransferase involved in cell wall biosynthesis